MSSHKYHVTVEDCVDEDDYRQSQNSKGFVDIDINQINCNSSIEDMSTRGSKRQAWEEVDALEEQARSEKIHDQSMARANATEAARIVKEAQQQSSGI